MGFYLIQRTVKNITNTQGKRNMEAKELQLHSEI
jgi:hypothetical protein